MLNSCTCVFVQMKKLTLNEIDGEKAPELQRYDVEVLRDVSKEATQQELTLLDERLGGMKPNMAAIAEYRKKAGHLSRTC